MFKTLLVTTLTFLLIAGSQLSATPMLLTVQELGQITQDARTLDDRQELKARLSKWQDKRITLRGFPYQSNDGHWILAPQPNLKTCCVGSAHNAHSQVHIRGDIPPVNLGSVVALTGTLHANPEYDGNGHLQALFDLDDIVEVDEDTAKDSISLTLFIGLFLSISVFIFSSRLMKRQS